MRSHLLASARGLTALLLCLVVASASAATQSLWTVKGKRNTVYLLGSLHLLRANESLPSEMEAAYRDAETLVMEIDMDDLDPLASQQTMMQLGMLPAGETLAKQLGPEIAARFDAETQRIGVPSAMLQQFQPWLAAIMLTQFHFMKLGFDPQSGVEQRFVAKASADHKEIEGLGLETLEEQLKLLANLPPALQKQFLLQTLDEAEQAEQEIESMLKAWRTGDSAALAKYVERGMKDFPQVYRPLTVDRNRRWLSRLEQFLSADQDYLVIVGALHLVGKDGVVELLKAKGYSINQR